MKIWSGNVNREMTRHGRNQTASAVYSYQEKKKDSAKSGYGSQTQRLGKDSLREFDACCLTLQPCREPVITPDGYLYDKEAILESFVHQKTENARKMKEYEEQKKRKQDEVKDEARSSAQDKVDKFLASQGSILSKPVDPFKAGGEGSSSSARASVSNMTGGEASKLPSFWIPELTPQAKEADIKKPDNKTYCPMSGKPMKVKDLTPVKFTVLDGKEKSRQKLIVKEARYKCPVTGDTLGSSVPSAVLRPSGDVVTLECVEKLIRKDMICPITGQRLKESDIIVMQRGGTGFAATGLQMQATKEGAAMTV